MVSTGTDLMLLQSLTPHSQISSLFVVGKRNLIIFAGGSFRDVCCFDRSFSGGNLFTLLV